ncbi:hypothetical protein FPOAC2_09907 [Fusarium poae]|uniref:hypothetical protein n=1 Tax=Fusarium poae TaxID=36050 RepID=UPI001CE9FE02|nr:hypothetical protein FPOAC1_009966 [Fusarium poae]KAG8670544.1 hypothetical protein FPOAC1_009966 [Fusarium poae]
MARKKSSRSAKAHYEHTQNKSAEDNATQDGPSRTNTDLLNYEAKGRQFPQFRELPYDVRAMIWEEALANQRILRISLEKRETSTRNKYQRRKATKAKGKKARKVEDEEEPSAPEKTYRVVVEERYAISKLFHICSESRRAAESFYRVRVPCTYKWGNKTQEGTFYFRPEFDNIQVGITEYLSDFAFDLWQLDSRYVGLINLTLPWQPNVRKIMEMDDHERDILRGVLLRLQNVSFAHMQEKPRAAPPPVRTLAYVHSMQMANANGNTTNDNDGEPTPPKPRTGWEPDCTGPISTCIPSFERLPVDPREMGNDHTRPYFSFKNPVHIALSWFRLLESIEATYEHRVNYRFMLSYETTGRNIATRDQATSWVQSQRKNFKARAVSEGLEHGEWVQPAMGFWMYPIECVGSLVDDEGVLKTAKDVLEGVELEDIMSKYAPELCLSRLV